MEIRNSKGQFVKGANIKDIAGKRYGKLVAVRFSHIKNGRTYWLCKCDCGNEKAIRSDYLPMIQSCGCVKKEQDKKNLHIVNNHGLTHHPAYTIWYGIIQRCTRPTFEHYKDYGGRGITVCDEWKDPTNFCKWADETGFVGGKNLSIERIDVDGNYEPSNCIWIDRKEQAYNKRNTLYYIDSDGNKKSIAKRAKELGLNYKTVRTRLKKGIRNEKVLFFNGNILDCEAYEERFNAG